MDNTQGPSKILLAARAVMARYGYAGATIAKVAEEAGVSRGLLHYHFKSKEDMLAKVLRVNMDQCAVMADAVFETIGGPEQLADAILATLKTLIKDDPETYTLFLEGMAAARYSEVVSQELSHSYARFRATLSSGVQKLVDRGVVEPPLSVEGLTTLLAAILDGLGLQLLAIPGLKDDDAWWESLRTGFLILIKGETAPAHTTREDS